MEELQQERLGGFYHHHNKFYQCTNLQGDVMYLVDSSGAEVAAYDYDPYGKIISATGSMAEVNPLRYRGYYYDSETGFYYLQSRYYDPEICRFINADSYASTGQSLLGYNAFAYCGNNPVMRIDHGGDFWMLIGAAVGAVVGGAVSAISQGLEKGFNNINWGVVGVNAAAGAISGALASTGVGLVASVGINAALGGGTNANCNSNNRSRNNSNYSWHCAF